MGTARKPFSAALIVVGAMLALAAPAARAAAIGGVVPDVPRGTPSPHVLRAFASALGYQGGPVMQTNRTHVIFWDPDTTKFSWDAGYKQLIIKFLTDVQADSHKSTNIYALTGQYYDNTRSPPVHALYDSTYSGSIDDTDPVPAPGTSTPCKMPTADQGGPGWTTCINRSQLEAEVHNVVARNGLPTGLTDVYFVVMPNGVGSCFDDGPDDCSLGGSAMDGFCGFHTSFDAAGAHYLYADIPYNDVPPHCRSAGFPQPNASTADVTISTLSHEHNEAITDPLPDKGSAAWQNAGDIENGDLCMGSFGANLGGSSGASAYNEAIGTGHYYTQEEWSNEDGGCAARDEADTVDFSATATRPPGTPVTFNSSAADPDGLIAATTWDFGDGSAPVSGTRASHVFARAGVYQVTLHTEDIAGQRQAVTKPVTVVSSSGSPPVTAAPSPKKTAAPSPQNTAAPSPRVSTTVKARTLQIAVNAPGTIIVGSTRKSATRAGTVTVKLDLSPKQRRRLDSGHAVRVKVKITFVPRVGPKRTRSVTVTVRPQPRHRRRARGRLR